MFGKVLGSLLGLSVVLSASPSFAQDRCRLEEIQVDDWRYEEPNVAVCLYAVQRLSTRNAFSPAPSDIAALADEIAQGASSGGFTKDAYGYSKMLSVPGGAVHITTSNPRWRASSTQDARALIEKVAIAVIGHLLAGDSSQNYIWWTISDENRVVYTFQLLAAAVSDAVQ